MQRRLGGTGAAVRTADGAEAAQALPLGKVQRLAAVRGPVRQIQLDLARIFDRHYDLATLELVE